MTLITILHQVVLYIDKEIVPEIPFLDQTLNSLQKRLNIKRFYLLFGSISSVLVILAITYFFTLTRYCIFWLYPSIQTIKTLQTQEKNEMIHWLNYWTVLTFLMPIHYYTNVLFHLIPFSNLLISLFGLWCHNTQTNGATILMNYYVRPFYQWLLKNSLGYDGNIFDRLLALNLGDKATIVRIRNHRKAIATSNNLRKRERTKPN
ncbi:adenosine 3'-phospho 5'-phosphosulfate transporter 1 [Sarcoptes scabiei]|nr:adenosine 3'-phospho 5'-phosphosulfate transporter 1 [Sarcoptes scabiei]